MRLNPLPYSNENIQQEKLEREERMIRTLKRKYAQIKSPNTPRSWRSNIEIALLGIRIQYFDFRTSMRNLHALPRPIYNNGYGDF